MSHFGNSPFGVQLKSKRTTARTGETVNAGFGVKLKKIATSETTNGDKGNIKLKSFDKDSATILPNLSALNGGKTNNGYAKSGWNEVWGQAFGFLSHNLFLLHN